MERIYGVQIVFYYDSLGTRSSVEHLRVVAPNREEANRIMRQYARRKYDSSWWDMPGSRGGEGSDARSPTVKIGKVWPLTDESRVLTVMEGSNED